jgi:hypothetical protein
VCVVAEIRRSLRRATLERGGFQQSPLTRRRTRRTFVLPIVGGSPKKPVPTDPGCHDVRGRNPQRQASFAATTTSRTTGTSNCYVSTKVFIGHGTQINVIPVTAHRHSTRATPIGSGRATEGEGDVFQRSCPIPRRCFLGP